MRTTTRGAQGARWDAPFWAGVLLAVVSVGALGCFGLAASAQTGPRANAELLNTDNCPPPANL